MIWIEYFRFSKITGFLKHVWIECSVFTIPFFRHFLLHATSACVINWSCSLTASGFHSPWLHQDVDWLELTSFGWALNLNQQHAEEYLKNLRAHCDILHCQAQSTFSRDVINAVKHAAWAEQHVALTLPIPLLLEHLMREDWCIKRRRACNTFLVKRIRVKDNLALT